MAYPYHIERRGVDLVVERYDHTEEWSFATSEEAEARLAFILEAMSWIGTPFVDCADIKGPKGAVDCAMMLVRSAVDTGRFEPFDPRPYSPRWHLHKEEELFIDWIQNKLGAREVESPRLGDVILWQFGRTFSHGAVLINRDEVVHSYYVVRSCIVSRLEEDTLKWVGHGGHNWPRPIKYFDLWSQ